MHTFGLATQARDCLLSNLQGFLGAVFDNRYVYFVPGTGGIFLRYDTLGSFTSSLSWSAFDASFTSGLSTVSFLGGYFDGTYVYFPTVDQSSNNELRYYPAAVTVNSKQVVVSIAKTQKEMWLHIVILMLFYCLG